MMVANPAVHFAALAEAGAQRVVFHVETVADVASTLDLARAAGCEVGVALSPGIEVGEVAPLLASLDEVIVMLIVPGKGGQAMQPKYLSKVRELRSLVDAGGLDVALEVDGGVKAHNAVDCVAAGADVLVAGSTVFNPDETPQEALAALRLALG